MQLSRITPKTIAEQYHSLRPDSRGEGLAPAMLVTWKTRTRLRRRTLMTACQRRCVSCHMAHAHSSPKASPTRQDAAGKAHSAHLQGHHVSAEASHDLCCGALTAAGQGAFAIGLRVPHSQGQGAVQGIADMHAHAQWQAQRVIRKLCARKGQAHSCPACALATPHCPAGTRM